MDTPFGLQVHHPHFLEWVGALESACLLGRPPAECLHVMSREQTLDATLQLQRDTSLMLSNLTVMQQYAINLHRTASDILQSVFGRQFLPSAAVNAAALVPPCSPRLYTHGSYGPLAPIEWPWWSRNGSYSQGPPVFRMPGLSSTSVRLLASSYPAGPVNCVVYCL